MSDQTMCQKCRKRRTCKTPCAFVDEILKQDNRTVFERTEDDIAVVYPQWREVQESVLRREYDDTGKQDEYEVFNTEADLPWMSTEYQLDRTHVFIMLVFKGWSWDDIAIALDTDSEQVRHLYKDSVKRLLKALEVMDKRQAVVDDVQSRLAISEKATGKLTKTQIWFLLNKVFGLLPREIAEMEGANIKTVCARIKDVYDRVVTGDVIFTDPTPEQIEAAHQRIEKKRARDRKAKAA